MAEGFACAVETPPYYAEELIDFHSACEGLDFYGEHGGKRYCVLHFPGEEKKEDLKKVIESKLAQKDYYFSGTVFPEGTANFGAAAFKGTKFDADTIFAGTTFLGRADFSHARFGGEITDFSGAHFSGDSTNFSEAVFSGDRTDFSHAVFSGKDADFSDARFSAAWTGFFLAHFSGDSTNFSEAVFSGDRTYFLGTRFSAAWTGFLAAQFISGEKTSFSNAHFNGTNTNFAGTAFKKEVDFTGATFRERIRFEGTKANLVFGSEAWAQFTDCRIEKPELLTFNNVLLHPGWFINTDVRKVVFTNVKWYGMPGGPEGTVKEEITKLQEHRVESPHTLLAQACRRLSINAEENREYPLANEFHYWSMEALRQEGWRCLGPIESLYWIASGCGERPPRAFGVLVGMWLLFAMLYMLTGFPQLPAFSLADVAQVGQVLVYSLAAMTRLTETPAMVQLTGLVQPSKPGLFQFLVTVEGILGPLQIALFLLAVRRKVMR